MDLDKVVNTLKESYTFIDTKYGKGTLNKLTDKISGLVIARKEAESQMGLFERVKDRFIHLFSRQGFNTQAEYAEHIIEKFRKNNEGTI